MMLTNDKLDPSIAFKSAPHKPVAPDVPSFAFDPEDPWTETFQRGLKNAELAGKTAYEVGIGTGTNAAFLLSICGAERVYGSDLDPRLAELAQANVQSLAPDQAHKFHPVHGPVSLIDTEEARAQVAQAHVVIASLPQVGEPNDTRFTAIRDALSVPLAEGAEEQADDHIAHYYPWAAFDEYPYNSVGLGLNEALLKRLRKHAPQAEVIMNFGSRIGANIIFECFEANGFKPEKLSSQIVRQHSGTDISFFVALEKTLQGSGFEEDFMCHFFADENATVRLSACDAQRQMRQNPEAPLYHEVCVIRGTPVNR